MGNSATPRSSGARGELLARADFRASGETPARARGAGPGALRAAVGAATHVAPLGVVVVMPPDMESDARWSTAADQRVRVVDLRTVPVLQEDSLRLDGFHFSAGGNSRAAEAVAPAVT